MARCCSGISVDGRGKCDLGEKKEKIDQVVQKKTEDWSKNHLSYETWYDNQAVNVVK